MRFQCSSSSSLASQLRQADLRQHVADPIVAERFGVRGIDDGSVQRADRKIWPLRQHHQRCLGGNRNHAAAERPDAGDGPEQGRLAGARGAGHQRALVGADAKSVGRDQRHAIGQADQKLFADRCRRSPCRTEPRRSDRHWWRERWRSAIDALKSVETRDDGPPLRERAIGRHEERQRGLHIAEGGRGLHHAAELDLVWRNRPAPPG